MKTKNLFRLLLISLTMAFSISSCNKKDEPKQNGPMTQEEVTKILGEYDGNLVVMMGAKEMSDTKMSFNLEDNGKGGAKLSIADFPGMGPKMLVKGVSIPNLMFEKSGDKIVVKSESATGKATMGKEFDSTTKTEGSIMGKMLDLKVQWSIKGAPHAFILKIKGTKK